MVIIILSWANDLTIIYTNHHDGFDYERNGRTHMGEVCVYGVKDGKIAFNQFFFTPIAMLYYLLKIF